MNVRLASLEHAVAELTRLRDAGPLTMVGAWSPHQVWTHCAQSVRYSMTGFPAPRGFLVRKVIGPIVAGRFLRRGFMSHDRAAPIPGAPAIPKEGDAAAALADLLAALGEFRDFTGPLAPHFAFGALDKDRFGRLHALHLADHLGELGG